MEKQSVDYFKRAVELSYRALEQGNDGFASILVGPDGAVLLEATNTAKTDGDTTAHDAINLARAACRAYTPDFLANCTLYATLEPCIMCMGAIYWAGIGCVKYAVKEEEYGAMRGGGGLDLHSAEFAARCPRPLVVEGPCAEARDETLAVIRAHIRKKTGAAS